MHLMRCSTAKKGQMLIKLHLEKAYDRMEWSFVEDMLKDVALPNNLVQVIMGLIRRSCYKLLWNGEISDTIISSRGLQKGDPISSYLFVLFLERPSHWIHNMVE